jgi:hypothetical protein
VRDPLSSINYDYFIAKKLTVKPCETFNGLLGKDFWLFTRGFHSFVIPQKQLIIEGQSGAADVAAAFAELKNFRGNSLDSTEF